MDRHRSRSRSRAARCARRAAAIAAPLAALALAASAPSAAALDYCVADAACVAGGGVAMPSLAQALTAAATSPSDDRLLLGAGTFPVPSAGFIYGAASGLELVGAGRDRTILAQTVFGPPTYPWSLTLQRTGSALSVRDLGIRVGDGAGGRGLRLLGADATRVAVTAPAGAAGATGVSADAGTLRDLDVSLGVSSQAAQLGGGGEVDVSGGSFSVADGTAIQVEQLPGLPAVRLQALRARGRTALSVVLGRATVDDALLRGSGQGAVVLVANSNQVSGELRAVLRQTTIVGDGSALQRGVEVRAAKSGQHASAKLLDSIVAAVVRPLARSVVAGDANIVTDHVFHGPVAAGDNPSTPAGGTLSESAVIGADDGGAPAGAADPGFVDLAAGDLRLRPDSPLVDAGRTDPLDLDEPATDIAGAARIADGDGDGAATRDLGAWESPPSSRRARRPLRPLRRRPRRPRPIPRPRPRAPRHRTLAPLLQTRAHLTQIAARMPQSGARVPQTAARRSSCGCG